MTRARGHLALRLVAVAIVLGTSAVTCGLSLAARPTAAGHYYGYTASESSPGGPIDVDAELRVAYDRRRFEDGSYVRLVAYCPRDFLSVTVSLGHAHGHPVAISRAGRFALRGSARSLRYRLKGRFLGPEYARITYSLKDSSRPRKAGRCRVPKYPVAAYLNGERPFSNCRAHKARTLSSSPDGRVFEQYRLDHFGFWPYAYGCLYDGFGGSAVVLGRNWDDERVEHAKVRGAYAGYASVGCGASNCSAAIVVKYLLFPGGTVKAAPSVFGSRDTGEAVGSLVLKSNSSVAWITARSAPLDPSLPGSPPHAEVHAFDEQGWRMLDTGAAIVPDSLALDEASSTLSWVNDGMTKTATLH